MFPYNERTLIPGMPFGLQNNVRSPVGTRDVSWFAK